MDISEVFFGGVFGFLVAVFLGAMFLPSPKQIREQIREEVRFEFLCEVKRGKLYTTKYARICVLDGTEVLLEQK